MNNNTTTDTLSDDELDARLRTTFATVMPLLDPRPTATSNVVVGNDSEHNDDALIFDLAAAPSSPNPRRMVGILGAAAASALVVAGLAFAQRDQTETPVASQPVELPSASQPETTVTTISVADTTIPVQGGSGGSSLPEVFPPKLLLELDGWEVAAGDLGDRFVRYLFVHLDGRQLDVTVEAGGIESTWTESQRSRPMPSRRSTTFPRSRTSRPSADTNSTRSSNQEATGYSKPWVAASRAKKISWPPSPPSNQQPA